MLLESIDFFLSPLPAGTNHDDFENQGSPLVTFWKYLCSDLNPLAVFAFTETSKAII